ncbi:MAG: hypothetical protein H6736_12765 [Alphaproteobacteria bacterium]|nr:hypothetical protein [Alphaproteobacteria bacterium]
MEAGHDVVVAGSDKRLAQLVGKGVWFYDAYKDVRYTPDRVHKRFGVGPASVGDWLALVGDEGIPGIKGVGAKGAVGLIEAHGDAEGIVAAVETVEGRTGNALRKAGVDALRASFALCRLDDPPLSGLVPYTPPDPEALNALYLDLGFAGLLKPTEAPSGYRTASTAEEVRALVASLGDAPVSVYALTEDPSPVRGDLLGLALSAAPDTATWVPLEALDGLSGWLADPACPKLGHDVKAATVALARRGSTLAGVVGDTALASHLVSPSGMAPHELDPLCRVRLHRALQDPDAVLGRGNGRKRWAQVPAGKRAAFACQRAEAALALWSTFVPTDAVRMAEDLDLCETLVRMELRGMPVSAGELDTVGEDFEAIRAELEGEIFALAGHDFALNSPKQLGDVLFGELGLPVLSRTKTGWSTASHVLERLEHEHPIVPLVVRWRLLRRLQDSWVTALLAAIEPDGRVRSTFHPARSFTGRLVNSHPDLGRVPGRTPEMARIRRAFRAPPGTVLLSIDYDQLGLYVLAHLSRDPALVGPLSRGEDIHAATARAVLLREDIDADDRQLGKVVNFATFAGQGRNALAQQLGVTAEEAGVLIDRFDRRYAGVRAWQDGQLEEARASHITTIAGRPWPIPDLDSEDPMIRSYAERLARRATHEASVADVTRRGLLLADHALRDAGLRTGPLLQIHDEVLFEVPDGELEAAMELAGDAMRQAYPLVVPLRVGFEVGPSWSELGTPARG